jgi:hypothetical protein
LGINHKYVFQQIKNYLFKNKVEYVQNTKAQVEPEMEEDSYQAIEEFFKLLPIYSGMSQNNILFVIDGFRSSIYDPRKLEKDRASYSYKMIQYFINKARDNEYELVNMHDIFDRHYQKNQQKFEFSTDYHWSGIGHKVVAESILKTDLFKRTF